MTLGRAAALAVILGAAPARADEAPAIRPDPRAVAEAREANLVPESVREGFAIGLAVGPAMQLGYGISESSGTGPGFNLRVGTVASPRWIWLLEISTTAYRAEDDRGVARVNQSAVVTFGGQLYVNDAFWLRGGPGFATFTRRTEDTETASFGGLGVVGAGGFDLLRRGGLAMSAEAMTSLALYRDGTVFGAALQLGVSWY